MAAPSGTVWGSIIGGYGRIGIYTSLSSTNTGTTLTAQIWFWSKYSVSDSTNTLYYDILNSAGSATTSRGSRSISTSVASGDGWSTSNQVKLTEWGYNYARGTTVATKYIYAALSNVDRVGGTMYASTTFTIPALPTYAITYNANGGSGAPSSQTKTYGKALTLSSTKPTRTGYTFQGWGTSASATTVAYAPSASYTTNAALNLYAIWEANTYTVSYNANGGSGAPSSQTKTHGTALTLSSTKPTRTNYNFLGWSLSPSSKVVQYSAGSTYTTNGAATLYAVWELGYINPIIYNLTVARCDSSGTATDTGTCGLIKFDWETTNTVSAITIAWESTAGSGSATVSASGTSGSVSQIIGGSALSIDVSYTITVTVSDSGGNSNAKTTLNGAIFPIDVLAGGKGVSFGKPAELEGVADFALEAKFNKPVYGKALGMDRLPAIPSDSDLNSYMEPGCYAIHSNAVAATVANIPIARAGRLEVWSATGEGIRLEQWSYLRQRFVPYDRYNAVWERDITRNESNVWTYYDWWQSSLTPAAAQKIYSTKGAITVALNDNTTLSTVNAYTHLPFKLIARNADSGKLTLEDGAIKFVKGFTDPSTYSSRYVKVSGQVLIKCGSVTGNRHIRIQRVLLSGAVVNVAWACVYGVATSNTAYTLPPIVVSVNDGDQLRMVYYTSDATDYAASGSEANGWQTYMTVEEV